MRGTHFLITWSQCDGEHADVISTLENYAPLKSCVVGKEKHADGGTHFHAYVHFERRLDRTGIDALYFAGTRPQVLSKRTKNERRNARRYVQKDNDWIRYPDPESSAESDEDAPSNSEPLDIVAQARGSSSWIAFLQWSYENEVPYGYTQAAWNGANHTTNTIVDGDEVTGTILSDGLRLMSFDDTTRRALVLSGPTGCGKTTWAKRNMPRPSLFVSDKDDLKEFRPGYHKSIIFDDWQLECTDGTWKSWPVTAQIHLVDFDNSRSIRCRYISARIPTGVFKCFTCNEGRYPLSRDSAVQRRVYNFDC